MLNQIVLVGRLTKNVEVVEGENGSKYAVLSLTIPRSWKNVDGEYENDYVDCKAFDSIATNTKEYCNKGDIVGVKGRIQTRQDIQEDGEITNKTTEIIAEKVTFLSSHKVDE